MAGANLEKIQQNILTRLRERSQADQPAEPKCCCGGKNFWYVEYTDEGRRFRPCPYCSPRWKCKVCGGTGHTKAFNAQGVDEISPGSCPCMVLEKGVALLNGADIPSRHLFATFLSEDMPLPEPLLQTSEKCQKKYRNILRVVERFVDAGMNAISERRPLERYFLTLLGGVGTGKTYLAVAALKRFILDGAIQGRFVDFQALLSLISDSYKNEKVSEEEIMRPLRQVDVLVIDEFGKGRTKAEWPLEKLDDLVNSRYNSRKITIITTNYLPSHMRMRMIETGQKAHAQHHVQPVVDPEKLEAMQWFARNHQDERFRGNPFESFWLQSLEQRIGDRMWDRLREVSVVVDFLGLPSFRAHAGQVFWEQASEEED